uniref:Aminomethyltransferase, mitochondrial n=1 Tax=Timema cristinae TaxID=61476 RepID=A0A7R9D5U3_TIMCR|nr:unnamed protein product [Timema cristinae]
MQPVKVDRSFPLLKRIHPSHRMCYIPFGGKEIPFDSYEVLVSKGVLLTRFGETTDGVERSYPLIGAPSGVEEMLGKLPHGLVFSAHVYKTRGPRLNSRMVSWVLIQKVEPPQQTPGSVGFITTKEEINFGSCINNSQEGWYDRCGRCYSTQGDRAVDEPCKTSLYDFHVKRSGKMVPFAGFLLPVSYGGESIAASHLHTRKHCSVFDVSHMLQTEIRGKDRLKFLESLCTADLENLEANKSVLTVFTDSITGGILDDLVVTKTALGYLHVVSNASRRYQDQLLMIKAQDTWRSSGKDVQCQFLPPEERALLAVQGPETAQVLNSLVDVDLEQLTFMTSTLATVGDVPRCRVTRCGYTGEDGVEISVRGDKAEYLAGLLLESSSVKMAGLGARDTLRLEAGMCLHGSDIDHTTTPVEAGLSFVIGKFMTSHRRSGGGKVGTSPDPK